VNRKKVELLCYVCLVLTSFFCAGQVAPSGGPPDKTPPEIIVTVPSSGATNFHAAKIRIEFSKYVNPLKMQQSLFVSPNLGTLSYDWSGKSLEIQFNDSLLRPNTTYIFTIGTDLEDTRGNKLAQAFALPFSTGNHIDSASIAGKVIDEKPVGVMIFAYDLTHRQPDTLNPAHTPPDFLSQTGKDGNFKLTNLAPGMYRLFAVRDEFKNLLYDPQTDQYGAASSDVQIVTPTASVTGVQFRMASEDTSRPFLSSARATDRSHVLLRFSKPMDTVHVNMGSVTVTDTSGNKPLQLLDVSIMESSLEAEIVTAPQESAKVYRIVCSGVHDVHGNLLNDSIGSPFFDGSILHDTSKPVMKFFVEQDSARGIDPEDSITISFSEPVRRGSFEQGFLMLDSTTKELAGTLVWQGSKRAIFLPSKPLGYGEWYAASIRLDSVVDFAGIPGKSTTLRRRFQTIPENVLGSITGTVGDAVENTQGNVYLLATDIDDKNHKTYRAVLTSPGAFDIEHLPEGKFTLWSFRDVDSNKTYSYGSLYPYHPAERFTVYPDTLKVRARWPLEGVNLQLKRF